MPLRKLLIYGGCHALVMRDLLSTLFPNDVAVTLLVNFQMIQKGQPFPYDTLREFDCVFYSPIENKGDYNTTHVVAACQALGVDVFCFPWLEWHGYCPDAAKGYFKNRFQWRYVGLAAAASSFDSFDRFADWAMEAYPDDATIDATFASSIAVLRSAEERYAMPIRVSDFILDHHRHSRLFLISDHPSLMLYLHVVVQILELIGLDGAARCAQLASQQEEPQWRWRTPIFPRVAERLDLRFDDTCWVDDEVVPGCSLDLRTYLLLYYFGDSVILGPIEAASNSQVSTDGGTCRVEPKTRLVAERLAGCADDARAEYRLIKVLSGCRMSIDRNHRFEIEKNQWRTAWG